MYNVLYSVHVFAASHKIKKKNKTDPITMTILAVYMKMCVYSIALVATKLNLFFVDLFIFIFIFTFCSFGR